LKMRNEQLKRAAVWLLPVLFSLPALLSCSKNSSVPKDVLIKLGLSKKEDKVVLSVEDVKFLNSDFERYVQANVGSVQPELTAASLSRLYDKFAEEKILLRAAQDQNVSLTEEEKKNYLIRLNNRSWQGGKKDDRVDPEKRDLFEPLLTEKYSYNLIKDIKVEEKEIAEFYELHKKEFLVPERVKVSQILLETEDRAVEVYNKVNKAPEEEFRKVAGEVSSGAESSKGGEMGIFKLGELPYNMEKVIFSLREGETSKVIESTYGYHIFRLDKRYEPELVTLEEASASIRVKILDEKIKAALARKVDELKKSMDWQPLPHNLSFVYERNVS